MSSSNKDVKIAPGAVVCVESKLKGHITVGSMTVVHPKASLIAESGPIIIGENNIIEEQASIIHKFKGDEADIQCPIALNIGVNNVFEVGCEIHAKSIGDHNVFEPKCFVGPEVEIGNGCIIGAGCYITVAERLPDQTVITGHHCARNISLDRPPDSDDIARQHDELTAMSEIFTKEEFSTKENESGVYTVFQAHNLLSNNFLLRLSKDASHTDFPTRHLPPIHLVANLPRDYPSKNPPSFTLSCCWLTRSKLDLLVERLEQLWEENHCEILFVWCSFLKEQSLEFLNIIDGYNLSDKIKIDLGIQKQVCGRNKSKDLRKDNYLRICNSTSDTASSKGESNNNKFCYQKRKKNYGPRKKLGDENDCLRLKAKDMLVKQGIDLVTAYHKEAVNQLYFYLIDYNVSRKKEEFKRTLQDCNTCFSSIPGELCRQLSCGHITCVECLRRMCEVHIKHGTMEAIVCSQYDCGLEIPTNLIQELISKELFDKFDKLMLNRTLDKISNMTYCPRIHCQYPISTQSEDALAICPSCEHAFCVFCKRAYHGVEGCRLKNEEKRELVDIYQSGNHEKRLELEKRYGKKQIAEMVNAVQSEVWLSENSKQCPCCHINIEKNDGCNKMICRKCNTNFCWMCLSRLSSLNPYLHFQDPKSRCYNLLFEGTYEAVGVGDRVDDLDDEEDEEFE